MAPDTPRREREKAVDLAFLVSAPAEERFAEGEVLYVVGRQSGASVRSGGRPSFVIDRDLADQVRQVVGSRAEELVDLAGVVAALSHRRCAESYPSNLIGRDVRQGGIGRIAELGFEGVEEGIDLIFVVSALQDRRLGDGDVVDAFGGE